MSSWSVNDNWYLPSAGQELRFSYVRAMYDQSGNNGLSLGEYYRNGNIVTSSSYVDDENYAANNTARNIPTTKSGLKLSDFRGAAKEENKIIISGDPINSYNITLTNTSPVTTRKIIQRYINERRIFQTNNGEHGVTINNQSDDILIIFHNSTTGRIYGGPGAGGQGGTGGKGGLKGFGGAGRTVYSINNEPNYPATQGKLGNPGGVGAGFINSRDPTKGGDGGHCIYVANYKPPQIFIYNEGTLKPGGGGGGGGGGGTGGSGGGGGGGGGKGNQGYTSGGRTYDGGNGGGGGVGEDGGKGGDGYDGLRGAYADAYYEYNGPLDLQDKPGGTPPPQIRNGNTGRNGESGATTCLPGKGGNGGKGGTGGRGGNGGHRGQRGDFGQDGGKGGDGGQGDPGTKGGDGDPGEDQGCGLQGPTDGNAGAELRDGNTEVNVGAPGGKGGSIYSISGGAGNISVTLYPE